MSIAHQVYYQTGSDEQSEPKKISSHSLCYTFNKMLSQAIDRYSLVCPECHKTFDPARVQTYCTDCQSPLLAQYDLEYLRKTINRDVFRARPHGMWRWHELLPVNDANYRVSLGEGNTPLLKLPQISNSLDMHHLLLKDESLNPTGTFKARGMASAVSKAVELGTSEFVIPTAGNAGGALAFYAGRTGCQAHVYMPQDSPAPIQYEVRISGADLHLVDGLINDAARLASMDAAQHGWFDMSTFKEPYRVEGKKIMGYEIAETLGWTLPDIIIYPTGGGTGLVGMWKAFDEMQTLGWIDAKRPRMVSVQAEGCAPVVRAFQAGTERIEPWQHAVTIASGLRVPAVFADRLVMRCLYQSNGNAVSVTDEEILAAQQELANSEGILSAPEGAAPLAALHKLIENGWCKVNETVVLLNTGTGLKYYPGNHDA